MRLALVCLFLFFTRLSRTRKPVRAPWEKGFRHVG